MVIWSFRGSILYRALTTHLEKRLPGRLFSPGSPVKKALYFLFSFFHTPRCHNFTNKIRRHNLTSFLESFSSVDFLQKVSVLHGISFIPNKHQEVSENLNFHKKTQKLEETPEIWRNFLFFRKFHFCRAKQNIFQFF